MGVVTEYKDAEDGSLEVYLDDWTQFDTYEDKVRCLAELARLRRMADAYAKSATDYRGTNTCAHCRRFTYPGTAMSVPHTATCDVAIHLDLPREKGEGE